jgi:hypothetical protein
MRISTMKWQAVRVVASSPNGLAREEAAALAATLDGIVRTLLTNPASEAIKAVEERLDLMAHLRDHAPMRKSAGRST